MVILYYEFLFSKNSFYYLNVLFCVDLFHFLFFLINILTNKHIFVEIISHFESYCVVGLYLDLLWMVPQFFVLLL